VELFGADEVAGVAAAAGTVDEESWFPPAGESAAKIGFHGATHRSTVNRAVPFFIIVIPRQWFTF
jgi:hypothetical protein